MYRPGVPRVFSTQSVCKSGTVLVPVQVLLVPVALKAKSNVQITKSEAQPAIQFHFSGKKKRLRINI